MKKVYEGLPKISRRALRTKKCFRNYVQENLKTLRFGRWRNCLEWNGTAYICVKGQVLIMYHAATE